MLFKGSLLSNDQSLQLAGVENGSTLLLVSGAMEVNGCVVVGNAKFKVVVCEKHMTVAAFKDVCYRKLGITRSFSRVA